MCSRFIELHKLNFKQWMTQTTLPLFLRAACLWERHSVVSLLKPHTQKRWRFFLFVCFLLLFLLLLFQMFPAPHRSPSSAVSFLTFPLFLPSPCRSSLSRPLSIPVSPLCKWQLWESTAACWCHVNQIRCHNRKSVHMHVDAVQWHAHMTYYRCEPNAGRVVTDTLTSICCGSKVAAALSQTASYSLRHIWHDAGSVGRFDQTSGSV